MMEDIIWHGVDEICTVGYSSWSLEFAVARVSTTLPATPSASPIGHDKLITMIFLGFVLICLQNTFLITRTRSGPEQKTLHDRITKTPLVNTIGPLMDTTKQVTWAIYIHRFLPCGRRLSTLLSVSSLSRLSLSLSPLSFSLSLNGQKRLHIG